MASPTFPVSVKGLVRLGDRVVLLENERGEFELPGGRMELGEQPQETLRREVLEELNLEIEVGSLRDAYSFAPIPGRHVLILIYETRVLDERTIALSDEHRSLGLFTMAELDHLPLPVGYLRALKLWSEFGSG